MIYSTVPLCVMVVFEVMNGIVICFAKTSDELEAKLEEFVDYYNNERYHESFNNVTPADVYFGRNKEILNGRRNIKIQTIKERRKLNGKKKISLNNY